MGFFDRLQHSLSKRIFWRKHLRESIDQIRKIRNELVSPDMFIAAPLLFRGSGYFKSMEVKQNLAELSGLVNTLSELELNNVCEIGTHKGGTLFVWCQLAAPNANIISIDLPGGDFGGGYSARSIPFFKSFAKPEQKLIFLRGNSHDSSIKKEFEHNLNGKKLDFLLIDGDHSYNGAKSDFHDYAPFVRKGGIIAFHDILKRTKYPRIEVWRFWQEIKSQYNSMEFIDESVSGRKIGIGALYKD